MSRKLLPLWLLLPAILLNPTGASAQEAALTKSEVEKTIRAYLLEHPEILTEMSQTLRQRQADAQRIKSEDALMSKRGELLADSSSPVAGTAKDGGGTVTIVEFFDYRCGYCKKVNSLVQKLLDEDPTIRVVFKEFPILGPESTNAAWAALAAHRQGGYLKFHKALMNSADLSQAALERIAGEAGLDVERLKKDMASPELQAAVTRNHALGEALSIQATPAFVIGTEIVPGALDESTMRELVAKAKAGMQQRASR